MAERLTAENWERAALEAIRDGSLDAVAVEPLARRLGVTKGSFYWHFESRDALLGAAIARWESDQLAPEPGERETDADAALDVLVGKALKLVGQPTIQRRLAAHADRDARIAAALERVARARVERIEALYRRLGLTPAKAKARAVVAYATILGLEELDRGGVLEVSEASLVRELRAALAP